MSKNQIMATLSRKASRAALVIKKHSPEILVVAGVVGIVASTVMACKATTKASDIIEETKQELDKIHEADEKFGEAATEEGEVKQKDLALVYAKTGLKFVKLYGPSIALGTVSLLCIIKSHDILRKRNVALAAAYATVDKGFKEYRGRVVDRFGEQLDRELRYNIKSKQIQETIIDENGNEQVVEKTVEVAEIGPYKSEYARFFDESCVGWSKDPESNKFFLLQQQNWANEKLKAKGHLFLNDVYEMLGFDITKAGAEVGWVYDKHNPDCSNVIDFGIFDVYGPHEQHNERKRAFVNGFERTILLDFNVDGSVFDLLQIKGRH